jgi:shikimate dehydrogenase
MESPFMSQRPIAHVGLIGDSLSLSLSPALHEREGRELGFDYHYEVFDTQVNPEVADLPRTLSTLVERGFLGSNITHPFKQEIMAHCDRVDPVASLVGAVNTLVFEDGQAVGYNTDWLGFLGSLQKNFASHDASSVVQVGAGGAGAAVAYALLRFGVKSLSVLDISFDKAYELEQRLAHSVPGGSIKAWPIEELSRLGQESSGIVNATPLGMVAHPGMPVPQDLITPDRWVHDVVYMPLVTELVRYARFVGAPVAGGGDMVVIQASEAITLFTGATADPERMMKHFEELVSSGVQDRLGGNSGSQAVADH